MNDLQGYRFPLMERVSNLAATGTLDELIFPKVPTGRIWVVNTLSVVDLTNAFTSLQVLIRGAGYDHFVLQDYSLLAARYYWFAGEIWVPETRTLVVQFTGATASDVLHAYINGFQLIAPKEG
jgi:hypothetical protein